MEIPAEVIIDTKRDKLGISEDINLENEHIALLLYVSDIDKGDHYNIVLDMDQAKRLHSWLGKYLTKYTK